MRAIPVASRVGGVPEMVQGTYAKGTLFTPGNIYEFDAKMELVLSLSNEQLTNIAMKLREETLRKFNEELTKKQLLKVFAS